MDDFLVALERQVWAIWLPVVASAALALGFAWVRGLPTCDKEHRKRQVPLSHNRCQCRKLLRRKSFRSGMQSTIETGTGVASTCLGVRQWPDRRVLFVFRIERHSRMKKTRKAMVPLAETALKRHFGKRPLQDLITASRTFPVTPRVDVQLALDKMFTKHSKAKLVGVHTQYQHETLTVAHLLGNQHFPVVIGPLQNEEIDIGETLPARCLRQGLWLVQDGAVPFALLLSSAFRFGHAEGTHIEIAVPPGEDGSHLSRRLLDELEALVRQTASYRGKVISLESPDRYSGHHGAPCVSTNSAMCNVMK